MFERAHRLAPNRIEPALGLARAASAVKDHEKAADAYRAVLKIDRNHPDALAGLGRELMTQGAAPGYSVSRKGAETAPRRLGA